MKRIAIYVCYDKQGIIDDYISYLLTDLKENLEKLVVVVNGILTPDGREKLMALTPYVVCRENKGLDAGAWKYAMTEYLGWEELSNYDEILLLNDTFFGPFYPFKKVFEKMDKTDLDFWGLTQHGKVDSDAYNCNPYGYWPRHIQSYFLCIRKKMHTSQEFKEYWEKQPEFKTWEEAVGMHETYFTKHFEDKGFKWDTFISNDEKDEPYSYNPCWANIYEILCQGYPIIKRNGFVRSLESYLSAGNGEEYRRAFEWIRKNTSYNTKLIFQNILRNYNISDIHDALHLDYVISDKFLEKHSVEFPKTCIVLHIFYAERLERYAPFIEKIPEEIDVFITTTSEEKKTIILNRFSSVLGRRLQVLVSKNRGRDIAALLVAARPYIKNYKYLCFCHDKRTKQVVYTIGNSFERILWDNTLKSQEYILNIISKFQEDEKLGFLSVPCPACSYNESNFTTHFYGPNFNNVQKLLNDLNISVPISNDKTCLTLGSAFWCKTEALAPLLNHEWKYEDFPEEPLPADGAISHAIERSFSFIAQSQGFYTGIAMTPEWASVFVNDYKYYFFDYYLKSRLIGYENLKEKEKHLENELNSIYHSRSWKLTKPLRISKKIVKAILNFIVPKKIHTAINIFRKEGISGIKRKLNEKKGILPEHTFTPIPYEVLKFDSYEKAALPHFENPKVSIIIPVYNQFKFTYACIQSILQTVKDVPYEIIIGDDLSTDETTKIKEIFPGIIVNKNETDHGFLMNCNRAAKLAKGKYILFLNNDTQVQKKWLSSLVTLIESDEKIGMVGSKLVYPDGTLQEAGGIIWNDGSGWNYGRGKDPEMPEYNYVKEVDYISGASIMIRSDLWKKIGGFDERFKPAYYEDSDLAFEVRKHGCKVVYQPDSVVIHFEGVSNGTDLNSGLKKYQVENSAKFREKWAEELKKQYKPCDSLFKARERNFDKKVIVVLDQYVPTFDKDAGSRTTYLYLKMFLQKGFVVKFIGDNYANKAMEPYSTFLRGMGIEYLYGEWYRKNIFSWIKVNEKNIDFFYMNRPHISEKYIDFVKKNTKIKVIYFGHDLHFLRMEREAEITKNKAELKSAKNFKARELSVMKKADVVYYPSNFEIDVIKKINRKIKAKAINLYMFESDKINVSYNAKERKNILFVGGFGHAPNIDAVKWFASDVFPIIQWKNSSINFYIVGSKAPDDIIKLNGNGIVFKGFVSDEELKQLYASVKIVVVPLRYGAGVKGKVLEALSNGCPLVTTSIGAEGIGGIDKVAVIKDSAEDFANAVVALYQNDGELERLSKAGVEFIKNNFNIDAAWNIIKKDFQ